MNIKLNNLYITNYDSQSIEKIKFINDLKNDKLITEFVYPNIDKMIKNSMDYDYLKIGCCYIISDNEKLVGFICPARIVNKYTLLLDYGVHPNYRNQGYGSKILLESSDYFLDNLTNIHNIKLNINSSNICSIKCAKKAGFKKIEEEFPTSFITYMKRR